MLAFCDGVGIVKTLDKSMMLMFGPKTSRRYLVLRWLVRILSLQPTFMNTPPSKASPPEPIVRRLIERDPLLTPHASEVCQLTVPDRNQRHFLSLYLPLRAALVLAPRPEVHR